MVFVFCFLIFYPFCHEDGKESNTFITQLTGLHLHPTLPYEPGTESF